MPLSFLSLSIFSALKQRIKENEFKITANKSASGCAERVERFYRLLLVKKVWYLIFCFCSILEWFKEDWQELNILGACINRVVCLYDSPFLINIPMMILPHSLMGSSYITEQLQSAIQINTNHKTEPDEQ